MNYYYNEQEKAFAVTTNFAYNSVPTGFIEITKERYDELQEELAKSNEDNENVNQMSTGNE
jgi:hypothetical protein